MPKAALLLGDPRLKVLALAPSAAADRLAGFPELLDDVEPIETDVGVGEELLLQRPENLGAVRDEQHLLELLGPVASPPRLGVDPSEERAIAHERRVRPLVRRALKRPSAARRSV